MVEIICAAVFAVLALISLMISIFQFREKGFLFNNAYIWVSKEEREKLNKKPHYRQSAIAFALVSAVLFISAIEFLLETKWLWIPVFALSIGLLIYAVASSVRETANKNA